MDGLQTTIEKLKANNPNFIKKINGYTMVPNWFIASNSFSIYEKMVLIVIKKHLMNKKECWPSIKTIAKEADCSEYSAKKAINSLVEKDRLTKKPNGHFRNNVYSTNI